MSFTLHDLNPLVRGDDWSIKLVLTQDGSVLDITGYTYYLTLKSDIDDTDVNAAIQVTASSTGSNATNGILYITADSADTATLEEKTYHYDIQQIDDAGLIQTLLIGKVRVIKDVTRATT